LDMGPLSNQERSELLEFTVAAPVLLELCAERAFADPSKLHEASRRTAALFREARDRSAVGVINVPSGSTMAAELDRFTAEAITHARDQIGSSQNPTQWR